MKKLKFIALGSYFVCIMFSTPSTIHSDVSWPDVGNGAVVAGAALIGIGGLVTLADWVFGETDEQLFERADKLYHSIYAQYHAITDWFEQSCHVHSINLQEYDRVIRNFSEQLLYDVATKIWYLNEYEAPYRSNLRAIIQQLRVYQEKLNKQIRKIRSQNHADTYANRLLYKMV